MGRTSCFNNHDFWNDAAVVLELTCSNASNVLVYKFKGGYYSVYEMLYYLFKICSI